MRTIITLLCLLIANLLRLAAQKPAQNTPLFEEIARMDSLLFEAVNQCDTVKFRSFLTADNEFYHDKGGLANLENTLKSTKRNCDDDRESTRRTLLKGTMEVFPCPGFGAMQLGSHQFWVTPKGGKEQAGGIFRFLHVWKKTDDGWKLARIMSYDH